MMAIEISPANGADLPKYSPPERQRRREIQVGQTYRLPLTQGRDISPQPSLDTTPSRASRRSGPTLSPLRASAPLREVTFRSFSAFTLLEVLVATAVLAMMLAFLFNLVGASSKLWEAGNKKIEAAQAARIGLNIMAKDLKNTFAGNMTSFSSNGTAMNNVAPFMAFGNNTTTTMGLGGGAVSANGSQQIAGVTLSNNSSIPYNEFGYMAVFINNDDGIDPMIGKRYYLVKKLEDIDPNKGGSGGNFYMKGNTTSTSWYIDPSAQFYPVADNCIRLKLEYYGDDELGDENDSRYSPDWTVTWSPENPTNRLPLGVLVTISVLDSKTAVKVNALKKGSALSDLEIHNGLSSSPSADLTDVERLISQGSVTMSRFIPFNRN